MPGQLLVDPATGQHFIVPSQGGTAPPPQPIYYQPMYLFILYYLMNTIWLIQTHSLISRYYPSPHGAPIQPSPTPHQFYGYAPVQGTDRDYSIYILTFHSISGYQMAPLPQFSSRFAVPAYSSGGRQQQYQQATCSTEETTRSGGEIREWTVRILRDLERDSDYDTTISIYL